MASLSVLVLVTVQPHLTWVLQVVLGAAAITMFIAVCGLLRLHIVVKNLRRGYRRRRWNHEVEYAWRITGYRMVLLSREDPRPATTIELAAPKRVASGPHGWKVLEGIPFTCEVRTWRRFSRSQWVRCRDPVPTLDNCLLTFFPDEFCQPGRGVPRQGRYQVRWQSPSLRSQFRRSKTMRTRIGADGVVILKWRWRARRKIRKVVRYLWALD